MDLRRLDEGQGMYAALTLHEATWHKSCRNKYKSTMFERALKRKHSEEESDPSTSLRSKVACVDSMHGSKCFFELELQIHED